VVDTDRRRVQSHLSDSLITILNLTPGTTAVYTIEAEDVLAGLSSFSSPCTVRTMQAQDITTFPFNINCGGDTSNGYHRDAAYVDGASYGFTAQPDTTYTLHSSTNHEEPYKSARAGQNLSYHFRLSPGRIYKAAVHLYDCWGTNVNDYNQHIINGGVHRRVFFFDMATRQRRDPWQEILYLPVSSGELMRIDFATILGKALVNGISIDTIPALSVLRPTEGDTFHVNDTLAIEWQADFLRTTSTVVELSVDGGRSWHNISPGLSVPHNRTVHRMYRWPIDSSQVPDTGTSNALIRISDYSNQDTQALSQLFGILP
jgi:hypothetical protein